MYRSAWLVDKSKLAILERVQGEIWHAMLLKYITQAEHSDD